MAELTQEKIEELIGKLKKHPYLCSAGSTDLGPLSGPPQVAPETETKDVTLYETQGDVHASYLIKNDLKVTVKTRDVDTAMTLQSGIKKGDNIYDPSKKVALTLVPITGATEKTITFANAYLQPGLTYTPGEDGEPSEVELVYLCKADATTGLPFAYA